VARPLQKTASRSSKEIELEDPFENMGAKLVHEVADKTSTLAGDGNDDRNRARSRDPSRRHAQHRGPVAIRRRSAAALRKAVSAATEQLDKMAKKVTSKQGNCQRLARSAQTTTK